MLLELNKVMVVGRLTRDPETRYLASGSAVANFDIAISRRYKDSKTNEYTEETSFVSVKAWNKQAEFVQQFMNKGKGVYVEGRLVQERWEKDGQKFSKVLINADRVTFAESKADEQARLARSGGGAAAASAPAGAAAPSAIDDADMPPMPRGESDAGESGTSDDLPF